MEEVWKFIPGYENYYKVSNFGNFESVERWIKDERTENGLRLYPAKKLKTETTKDNYQRIVLMKDGIKKRYMCHRLVAETFLEHKEGKDIVNHIDGNKSNNNVQNLEWCTHKENTKHAWETGLCKPHYYCSSNKMVKCIETNEVFISISEAARAIKRSTASLQNAIKRNGKCAGLTFVKVN